MKIRRDRLRRLILGYGLSALLVNAPPALGVGWGIDSCLTRHIEEVQFLPYIDVLTRARLEWIEERGVSVVLPNGCERDLRGRFLLLKQAGYSVLAYASLPNGLKPVDPTNVLMEDLREVYQGGHSLNRTFSDLVGAWEMVGEADLGYCTDLPDRVAAYQKALYLGIKAGSREQGAKSPIVLMGALGMPPGPWLERAAANGLLDYTDAYNFHFYGHAADLTGVIEAHRAAIAALRAKREARTADGGRLMTDGRLTTPSAPLPMWITECGIEAVDKKDFLNPQRRQVQADFTISTAKQALAAKDVAVFMPFILVHDGDPYAMTLSPFHTFPAWDAYAKFTKENPWPHRAWSSESQAVSPIVMQWLPDNRTTTPHKVSGTYRFKEGQAIKGELRVYNFGSAQVRGVIRAQLSDEGYVLLRPSETHVRVTSNDQPITRLKELEIPAMGMVAVPIEFAANSKGYFRETWAAAFVEEANPARRDQPSPGYGTASAGPPARSEGQSPKSAASVVCFGLEAEAKLSDFTEEPLPLRALPDGKIRFPQIEPYATGQQDGVWMTINGLKGEAVKPETGDLKPEGSAARFWIEQPNTDPLAPAMAVAAVDGLPTNGFLRLQLDKPMTKDRKVLVVLVDDRGQRYTIWENFGADYYGSRSDIWLNLEDFHADFWGHMSADYQFRPERIREVHLRLYLNTPNEPVGVTLSLLKAR